MEQQLPTKIYAVCCYAYEYNDEYNYQPDGSPSDPVAAFLSKELAEADMKKREIDRWRNDGFNIYDYLSGNGLSDYIDNEDEVLGVLQSEFGYEGSDAADFEVPTGLTDAQYERLMELFSFIDFYCVSELPLDPTLPAPAVELPAPDPGPAPDPKLEPEFVS
jgi:hypothetical protein